MDLPDLSVNLDALVHLDSQDLKVMLEPQVLLVPQVSLEVLDPLEELDPLVLLVLSVQLDPLVLLVLLEPLAEH